MTSRSWDTEREDGLAAALRRFPESAFRIRQLMLGNEAFKELCSDLAAAERALEDARHLPVNIREKRRDEFAEMADSLAKEIAEVLGSQGYP